VVGMFWVRASWNLADWLTKLQHRMALSTATVAGLPLLFVERNLARMVRSQNFAKASIRTRVMPSYIILAEGGITKHKALSA
jgi:hypothetical protein